MPPTKGMFSDRSSVSMPDSPRTKTVFLSDGRERIRDM